MKYEEFRVGTTFLSEPFGISDDELDGFAAKWDPLPQHVRGEQNATPSAPGLLTVCATWRAWVGMELLGDDGENGIGIDGIRFLKAVRPGDRLRLGVKVLEQRLTSKGRGLVKFGFEVTNEQGEVVLSLQPVSLVRRAAAADSADDAQTA